MVQRLDKGGLLHEGQTGSKVRCIDNISTFNEIVQGRLREGKITHAFFLHVQKAYNAVWRDGLQVRCGIWGNGGSCGV